MTKTTFVIATAGLLVLGGCAMQECSNPAETPQSNPQDFAACAGLTDPTGRQLYCQRPIDDPGAGGQLCPLPGSGAHQCIEVFPTPPNPMGLRYASDAGDGGGK
jgi:hypothetical protein